MLVTLLGMVTLVKLVQFKRIIPNACNAIGDGHAGQAGAISNAPHPMLVTLFPM